MNWKGCAFQRIFSAWCSVVGSLAIPEIFKCCILADTPSAVLWYRRCWVFETIRVSLWGYSQADCLTYNPRKRDSYTLKGPSRFICGTSLFTSCWLQGSRARLQGLSQWVCPACHRFSKSGGVGEGLQIFSRGISFCGRDFFCLYTVVPVQKSSDTKYMSCWCRTALCKESTVKRTWRLV